MKRPSYFQLQIAPIITIFLILAVSCKKIDKNLATVITSEISDKTTNSAKGGGEVTGDGGTSVSERGVCWSIYQNPTTADSKTSDGQGTGVFTSELKDLTPDKIFYVRAYATNSAGTAYGSEISFTTDTIGSGKSNFIDLRDGHDYRTQIIGNQTWMAENLAYLPAASGPLAGSESLPYYYVYGSDSNDVAIAKDSANYETYGVLYNWPAAMVSCPAGWHLPSVTEWNVLFESIGSPAGGKLKEIGKTHWEFPNTGATNESGFTAIPGGERYSLGKFRYITTYAVFWSTAIRDGASAWAWHLYYDKDTVNRDYFSKSNGFSVRCLKN